LIFHLLEFLVAALVSALVATDNPNMGLANSVSRTVAPTAADGMFYGRITIWGDTLQRLSEGFGLWFGWGGNGFIRMGLAHDFIFHPHNAVLQFLTDWGIIGTALFANLLRVAVHVLKGAAFRTSNGALATSILAYLLVMGMLDGGLYHPQFLVCAGLALGMLAVPAAKDGSGQLALRMYPVLGILAMTVVHLAML
jgi:O-antigen ligase